MSNVKKAALEYAIERVPESAKFKEQIIVGNHLREEIHDSFIRGFEFANEWHPCSEIPENSGFIILEFKGCSNSKKYVVYDFDPEYFEGVFHVNGVAERWRSFL